MSDQPFVDHWPMFDEALSKITAAFDIEAAREQLARKFNRRPVRLPKEVEIERAWEEHNESIRHSTGSRRRSSARSAALA
jgi:hypothetical protein